MAKRIQTPGVYIEEQNAFPNSAVPVPTAVPAFIGYTEKAVMDKKSLHLQPTRISSYSEYQQYFGGAPLTTYELLIPGDKGQEYSLVHPKNYFTLHSHMKLFFANGGPTCYIVSVGNYATADDPDKKIELQELAAGVKALEKESEPAMIVIPEAILYAGIAATTDDERQKAVADIGRIVYQEILQHCAEGQNRFAILDGWMDREKFEQKDYDMSRDISWFRSSIGTNNLQWGATYFPWLHTTAVSLEEVSFVNIRKRGSKADILPVKVENDQIDSSSKTDTSLANVPTGAAKNTAGSLISLLDEEFNTAIRDGKMNQKLLLVMKNKLEQLADDELEVADGKSLHRDLMATSTVYKTLMNDVRKELNLLPPSAIMAGIYSMVDQTVGVWQSPANVSVGSVVAPAVDISNNEQENMNMPLDGKAVNAIRSFPGKGVLVWGARTLDGNSQDWRYVSVRRTLIFIEQSIKFAIEPYVFSPNDAGTWANVKSLITNFLTNVWQSGALAGATAEDAFSVEVGLGTTMTTVDIVEGYMRVAVMVAVTRPAEFIVLTFQQKMQSA
ncbi:MAG: phage tail sheath C-terminal domain-containing protein [Saprospiraceae bacterium]